MGLKRGTTFNESALFESNASTNSPTIKNIATIASRRQTRGAIISNSFNKGAGGGLINNKVTSINNYENAQGCYVTVEESH